MRVQNPDFVAYAESFGATGYRIGAADELLPTLRTALAGDGVTPRTSASPRGRVG